LPENWTPRSYLRRQTSQEAEILQVMRREDAPQSLSVMRVFVHVKLLADDRFQCTLDGISTQVGSPVIQASFKQNLSLS